MDSYDFSAGAHAASLAAQDRLNSAAAEPAFVSSWVEAVDARIHCVSSGEGSVVLFIHGFPSFWYCWARQLEALRHHYRVVAIDAPGAGATTCANAVAPYRVSALATQINHLVQIIAPEQKVLLVGHDWGAALAFAVAQAFPERIAGVAGIASLPFNQVLALLANDKDQQRRSSYMQRLCAMSLEQAELTAHSIVAGAYAELASFDTVDSEEMALFELACGNPRALWNGSLWYRANLPNATRSPRDCMWPPADPSLDIPALLVWGEADEVFVPRAPEYFAAKHSDSTVLRLDGVGHWCMLQAPDEVNAALLEFADRCFGTIGMSRA
ncbi:alpha/beta fold hydrolase [Aquisediminimonas profunda]|uniref:alpha/beta fold hydrolase n=1 Tax=Aquisediminimonas profunda TaxID=1550733 RepID=UPI001C633A15|nr:alpha/beta hydrolase [Aquisediminimonas profunda]